MDIALSDYMLGFVSAVVTEGLKYFPKLRENELMRSATAFVVLFTVTFASLNWDFPKWSWVKFWNVAVFAFLNYKMIVQPTAKWAGSRSQTTQ